MRVGDDDLGTVGARGQFQVFKASAAPTVEPALSGLTQSALLRLTISGMTHL
ncbi:hypothetical protein [Allochromatium tepidum]|uniref:hypothetical protein n=1 Tax=Allochromatium tepidum TaxID=553982 RepID=UPI001BCF3269|nr:hypothetical protein [Allochromatium tepidum]